MVAKRRIDEIDILRGMTFLAIVMQHTLACFMYSPGISRDSALASALILTLVRYAVPMFIFITGLVLYYNHGDNQLNYGHFIKQRFTQIFIPYFVWTAIYYIWVSVSSGSPASSPYVIIANLVKLVIFGEGYYHLWFMVAILQFYLLFPIIKYMISNTKTRPIITLSIVGLLQIVLLWFYWYQVPVLFDSIRSPWLKTLLAYRDRIFISWFFYFILGSFAALYIDRLRELFSKIRIVNIIIFLLSLTYIFSQLMKTGSFDTSGAYILNNQFTGPLNYMMVLYISSSFVIIYDLSQTLFTKYKIIRKVLKTFGRYSFGCYFVHAMILTYINVWAKVYLHWMGSISLIVMSFLGCSALSLLACFLMSKLRPPWANLLVGRIPPKPKAETI
jgi:surface polysaccharide O-acyltransferase-like enzyme